MQKWFTTTDLVALLCEKYSEELVEVHKTLGERLFRLSDGGRLQDTTSLEDCLFLYLLVREFRPKVILEIGTWIGSTALSMAEAVRRNGEGRVYTVDVNSASRIPPSYDDVIQYFTRTHSDTALEILASKGVHIDFVFSDANIGRVTVERMKRISDERLIFVTHDFVPPLDKGIDACVSMRVQFPGPEYHWFPPDWRSHWKLCQRHNTKSGFPFRGGALSVDSGCCLMLHEERVRRLVGEGRSLVRHPLGLPIRLISHETGFCFHVTLAEFSAEADDMDHPTRSILRVYEDFEPLGSPHQIHDDIRQEGRGRFSHWNETVYFSSSDNTDPRTNGRQYTVVRDGDPSLPVVCYCLPKVSGD